VVDDEPPTLPALMRVICDNDPVYLFAAIVPPRAILDELWSIADVTPEVAREPRPVGWRASRPSGSRRRRHREVAVEEPPAPVPLLDLAPVAHVALTLAKFGNLTHNDAKRLQDALTEAAAEWPSPRLHLAGYNTDESAEEPSIWVDLAGDVDEVGIVARGVPRVAQRLRLFVDRRLFQPRVRLGSVNPGASAPHLESMLDELDLFETNAWWQTSFALLTHAERGPDEPPFKTYADVPLGPHVLH
jgi:2'-5' RNA ligase